MQGGFYLCGGEDEDLGGRNGVEPAFYPAPDCGEEGGGSYDLFYRLVQKRSLDTGEDTGEDTGGRTKILSKVSG